MVRYIDMIMSRLGVGSMVSGIVSNSKGLIVEPYRAISERWCTGYRYIGNYVYTKIGNWGNGPNGLVLLAIIYIVAHIAGDR